MGVLHFTSALGSMSVHYKFKSAKSYDIIPFEGSVISVRDLKMAIIEQKKLGTSGDFDLKFSNAQTKEEYIGEGTTIPKKYIRDRASCSGSLAEFIRYVWWLSHRARRPTGRSFRGRKIHKYPPL